MPSKPKPLMEQAELLVEALPSTDHTEQTHLLLALIVLELRALRVQLSVQQTVGQRLADILKPKRP